MEKKIDFVMLVNVNRANPNGDPLGGNRPRTDYNGFGEMSDGCIKRKIRNRMQDLGHSIFVQMDERADDGFFCLADRAKDLMGKDKDAAIFREKACKKWLDVRAFGQVFAFKKEGDGNSNGVSIGVRGPVTIHIPVSVAPVDVRQFQITKSVNGQSEKKDVISSDRMGNKFFVQHGLYVVRGSISGRLAEKTGFSAADAEVLKECLLSLFENDASSARPDGSMEVVKLYWFEHDSVDGQYPSAVVHRSVKVAVRDADNLPTCLDDYIITLDKLPGLKVEVLEGR